MISSVSIRDFQKHKRLKVHLHPAVTIVCGPSGSGKSGFLRAVRWAALNDPAGEEFVRDGGKRAKVKVRGDGKLVVRERGDGNNAYEIDGKKLTAFGTGLPDDVFAALRLSDLNFAAQLDSPYWVTASAGEVSRQLNEIVSLDLIDRTLSNLASFERTARERSKIALERLQAAEGEISRLTWADAADAVLGRLEGLSAELLDLDGAVRALEMARLEIWGLEEKAAKKPPPTANLEKTAKALQTCDAELATLTVARSELIRLENIARTAKKAAAVCSATLKASEAKGCPACGRPL